MKILAINGSPHKQGNTAYALSYALQQFEARGCEIRLIQLSELDIKPCGGCFHCIGHDCIHQDDMHVVEEALCWCDALVLGSPVYMGMVTGQMKTMMDRSVTLRVNDWQMSARSVVGSPAAASAMGGQELTLQNMQTYFLQQDMVAVADGPQFSHSGAAIVGKAAEDQIGLVTVENLAAKIFKIVKA